MTTTTKLPTIKFETQTCGRCGGSGTYPSSCWNGVCLGCSGAGVRYTRSGRVARLRYDEVMSRMNRTYGDVKIGDRVKASVGRVNTMGSTEKWLHVATIKVHEKSIKHGEGEWPDTLSFTFTELDPEKYWGLQAERSHTIMIWDEAIYLEAINACRRLKGATITDPEPVVDQIITMLDNAPTVADKILGTNDVAAPAGRVNGRTATGSHAACDHETTPAARRRCRAARNA